MEDRKELILCNCKDNKYHNLSGWHEDFCLYKKWWDGDEAAEQEMRRILGESAASDSESNPTPKPLI